MLGNQEEGLIEQCRAGQNRHAGEVSRVGGVIGRYRQRTAHRRFCFVLAHGAPAACK
jgi:hypothetical protein